MTVPTLSRKDDVVTPASPKPRQDYDEFASMRIPALAKLSLQRVTWGPPPLRRRQFASGVAWEVNVVHPAHVLVIQITDSNAKMEVQGAYFWKLKPESGPLVIYKAACPYADILIHHSDPEPETEAYSVTEDDLRRLQGRPWVQNIRIRGGASDEILYSDGMIHPLPPP